MGGRPGSFQETSRSAGFCFLQRELFYSISIFPETDTVTWDSPDSIGMGAAIFTGEYDIAVIMVKAGLGIAALVILVFSTVTTTV